MNVRPDAATFTSSVAFVQDRSPGDGVDRQEFDFVVVGSGADGGPVAANFTEAGHIVLLLQAGGREHLSCEVPAFHAVATEDESLRWDFFVRHYDDVQQMRGSRYVAEYDGVWYPRAGTSGCCATHNAVIMADPRLALRNRRLFKIIIDAGAHVLAETLGRPLTIIEGIDTYLADAADTPACAQRA